MADSAASSAGSKEVSCKLPLSTEAPTHEHLSHVRVSTGNVQCNQINHKHSKTSLRQHSASHGSWPNSALNCQGSRNEGVMQTLWTRATINILQEIIQLSKQFCCNTTLDLVRFPVSLCDSLYA